WSTRCCCSPVFSSDRVVLAGDLVIQGRQLSGLAALLQHLAVLRELGAVLCQLGAVLGLRLVQQRVLVLGVLVDLPLAPAGAALVRRLPAHRGGAPQPVQEPE